MGMYLNKVITYYKKHGLLKALVRSAEKLGFYSRKLLFFERDLQDWAGRAVDNLENIDQEKLEKINNYFDGWRNNRKSALTLLRKNHRLFVTRKNNEICSYTWIGTILPEASCLNLRFLLSGDTAYLAYNYTVENQRNKGVATSVTASVMSMLRDRGYRRIISLVASTNFASLRIKRKLGFSLFQECKYIRIHFVKFYICKNPYLNLKKIFVILGKNDNKIHKLFSKL